MKDPINIITDKNYDYSSGSWGSYNKTTKSWDPTIPVATNGQVREWILSEIASIKNTNAQTDTTLNNLLQSLSNKQDSIADLSTIRSGAAAGATAQQPATTIDGYGITDAYTKDEVDSAIESVDASADIATEVQRATAAELANADAIDSEVSRATIKENLINSRVDDIEDALETKADAATTLAGYGIIDGYTKTEGLALENTVDNRLDALDAAIELLNGSEVIVVDDHTAVTTPDSQKIYREQGTTSYTDWMYQNNTWKEIATYDVAGGAGDGVFDISAKTGDVYATLGAALTAANTVIPAGKKKGGMSIKFIHGENAQSSDNSYVQYRLMADSWSASVADWESIDTARANIVAYQFEFTDGYYLNTKDIPIESYAFSYTGYIPVGNRCTVYLYNTIKEEDSAIHLLIYNTNKEKISSISLADKGIGVVTLEINNPNAAFIRLTTYTSGKDKFFVCVDYSSQLSAIHQDINQYATLINISTLFPTGGNNGTDVYEPTNARNLVPTEKRKRGLLLTYKTTDGWIVEELNNDVFQTNDRYWNLLTKESLRNLVNYIGSYNSSHALGYLDGEGKFVGNSFNYTEMTYIPVDEGTPIYFATGTTSSRSSICFYTEKNEASFLSAIAGDGTSNPRFDVVPNGAKYVRYSYASSVKDTFVFKMGITALSAKANNGEDVVVEKIKNSYTDTDNTYFGNGAMANKSGDNCDFNAAFGVDALKEVENDGNVLDTGRYNAAFGHSALKKNTTGNHNTAVGYGAGNNITTGVGDIAIGEDAMNSCGGSAEANTAVGRYSLFKVTGSHNIGIGTNAGYDVSSGTYNILLGENAGYFSGSANNVTTDTFSIFIGDRAGKSVSTLLTNAIAIGSGAKVDSSNAVRIGNSSIAKVETYGDYSVLTNGGGIILKSPNGTPYKITVSDSGELVVTAVS